MTYSSPAPPRRAITEAPAEPPRTSRGDGLDWLRDLDWRAFERVVGDAFQRHGFTVLPTAYGADGGIDLVLVRGPERIFVQCKHWRAYRVGVQTVRELYGLVAAHRATGGIVVTSGTFTPEATEFARICGLVLMDGPATAVLTATGAAPPAPPVVVHPTLPGPPGAIAPALATPRAPAPWILAPWPAPDASRRIEPSQVPSCPICSAPMVRRRARRGPAAGTRFWGCSRFPGCKGVREANEGPIAVASSRPARATTRGSRVLRQLTYRLAQALAIVIAVGLTIGVMLWMLPAMLHH